MGGIIRLQGKHSERERHVQPTEASSRRLGKRGAFSAGLGVLIATQFAVFAVLTADGSDRTTRAQAVANALPMEAVGPPVLIAGAYEDLSVMSFSLRGANGQTIGTAAFAGPPSAWGGQVAVSPMPSLSGGLSGAVTNVANLASSGAETELFIVPAAMLSRAPLFVNVAGTSHRLSLVAKDPGHGFALTRTIFTSQQRASVGSSLPWLQTPIPRRIPVGMMIVRRNPNAPSYRLVSGELGDETSPGLVHAEVTGVGVGSPVIAVNQHLVPTLVGFVEAPGRATTRFVPASIAVAFLRLVSVNISPGTA